METQFEHKTVLLEEAVQALNVVADGCYIDGTFGRGGHSRLILKQLGADGCLLAIDKDPQAIIAAEQIQQNDRRFQIAQGSFSDVARLLADKNINKPVNGLLLDLGVSSPQLDDATRGFSFSGDGPLDMRMDITRGPTAAEWLAGSSEEEIIRVLRVYGEERFARRIARAIVETRLQTPLTSTAQLANLVAKAMPHHEKHKHPATRTFQAIRIEINRELTDLEQLLENTLDILGQGARLVIISFHSLEDRIVKRFIKLHSQAPRLPKGVPVQFEQTAGRLKAIGKAVFASAEEVKANPRSRSAVMRIAEVR